MSVTASPSTTQASISQTLPSTVPQKTAGEHNPYHVIISLNTTVCLTDKSVVYSQAPSTADLMVHVARKIPTKWYQVGILLRIETTTLDTFEKEVADHDQVRLCIKVFQQWEKEVKVPFTWETIVSILERLDEMKTAAELKEWLNK